MSQAEDFWLISVPGDKTPQEAWDKMMRAVQPSANIFKFSIPPLKVYPIIFIFRQNDLI